MQTRDKPKNFRVGGHGFWSSTLFAVSRSFHFTLEADLSLEQKHFVRNVRMLFYSRDTWFIETAL